jgi:Holliday junction resolvase RusA-like endonuclease
MAFSQQTPETLAASGVREIDQAGKRVDREHKPELIHPQETAPRGPLTVSLQGPPQGKGRARSFVRGGHIGHYTPEKTRTYEASIRAAAIAEIGAQPPLDEPVDLVLRAIFPVPVSWSERKRRQAITGDIKPGKPDLDNIVKAWTDALNGIAYRDDSLICRMAVEKRYGPQPLVVVTVRPIGGGL